MLGAAPAPERQALLSPDERPAGGTVWWALLHRVIEKKRLAALQATTQRKLDAKPGARCRARIGKPDMCSRSSRSKAPAAHNPNCQRLPSQVGICALHTQQPPPSSSRRNPLPAAPAPFVYNNHANRCRCSHATPKHRHNCHQLPPSASRASAFSRCRCSPSAPSRGAGRGSTTCTQK